METDLALWVHLKGIIGIAIAVFMAIVFFTSGLSQAQPSPLRIPEYIDTGVGFRESAPPVNHNAELQALRLELENLKKRSEPPIPKPKPKTTENPLVQECINALESLGEKRSAARATVNKYFLNNPNTKTVEQFIEGVFKR